MDRVAISPFVDKTPFFSIPDVPSSVSSFGRALRRSFKNCSSRLCPASSLAESHIDVVFESLPGRASTLGNIPFQEAGQALDDVAMLGAELLEQRDGSRPLGQPVLAGLPELGEAGDLVTLTEHPLLGLAKQLVSVNQDASDAQSSRVTFAFYLVNMGNVALGNVHATDSLASVFALPVTYSVVSVTSADFTVNGSFDGKTNLNLLAPGNTLAVGKTGVIQLVVEVHTGGNTGPYSNTATASATSPKGATVTDVSQNGSNPDPDGDGNPGDNSDPTVFSLPVAIAEIPTLGPAGLAVLAALLALAAWREVRRRRRGRT